MQATRRVNLEYVLGDMVFYANGGPTENNRKNLRRMYIEDASGKSDRVDTGNRSEGADAFGYNEFSYKYRPYFSSAYYWEDSREEDVRRPDYYYYEEKDMNVDWSTFESGGRRAANLPPIFRQCPSFGVSIRRNQRACTRPFRRTCFRALRHSVRQIRGRDSITFQPSLCPRCRTTRLIR